MNIPTVSTKAEFMALSAKGQLGNTFQRWDTLSLLEASGYQGWVTIRSKDRDSPFFIGWVQIEPTHKYLHRAQMLLRSKGAKPEDLDKLYFQEVPGPRTKRLMNAEIMGGGEVVGWKSPILKYGSSETMTLRDDLNENGAAVEGVAASIRLRHVCGDEAWTDVMEMLHRYPQSVIEFTVFDKPVGTEHRNTIFWEVRNY